MVAYAIAQVRQRRLHRHEDTGGAGGDGGVKRGAGGLAERGVPIDADVGEDDVKAAEGARCSSKRR
jgi:hypothetical protein